MSKALDVISGLAKERVRKEEGTEVKGGRKPGLGAHTSHPKTSEADTGGAGVESQSWLQRTCFGNKCAAKQKTPISWAWWSIPLTPALSGAEAESN